MDSIEVNFQCSVYDGYLYSSNRWTNAVLHYRRSDEDTFKRLSARRIGRLREVTEFSARIPRSPQSGMADDTECHEYYLSVELDGFPNTSWTYVICVEGMNIVRAEQVK